jgi:hypothetical protein
MKVSFYVKKGNRPNADIKCEIDTLQHTHQTPYEYNVNPVSGKMVSYLHSVDTGYFKLIGCPHMMRVEGGFIECYTNDVFRLEYEGKSEYWVAKYPTGWEQIVSH